MFKYLFSLLLIISFSSASFAEDLDLHDQDKQKHVAACFVITTGSYLVYHQGFKLSKTRSLIYAAATSMAIGLAKELTDPKFSGADLGADAIGTGVGIILPITFSF